VETEDRMKKKKDERQREKKQNKHNYHSPNTGQKKRKLKKAAGPKNQLSYAFGVNERGNRNENKDKHQRTKLNEKQQSYTIFTDTTYSPSGRKPPESRGAWCVLYVRRVILHGNRFC
jgi:hypothetical protein